MVIYIANHELNGLNFLENLDLESGFETRFGRDRSDPGTKGAGMLHDQDKCPSTTNQQPLRVA